MGFTSTSIAHVRLTVTDIERSRQFYESVFGWPVLLEVPEDADEATRNQLSFLFGGVIYDLGGTLLGLRPDRPRPGRHQGRAAVRHLHPLRCRLLDQLPGLRRNRPDPRRALRPVRRRPTAA